MTSETQFTPGPWAATPTAIIEHDYKATIRTAHSNVCSVIGATSRSRSEFDANARLIASAPSLHAALQALVEAVMKEDITKLAQFLPIQKAVTHAKALLDLGSSTPR